MSKIQLESPSSAFRAKVMSSDIAWEATIEDLFHGQPIIKKTTEWKVLCPHSYNHLGGVDESPSCSINIVSGYFNCPACRFRGAIPDLAAAVHNTNLRDTWAQFGKTAGIEIPDGFVPPELEHEIADNYHKDLMALQGPLRDKLKTVRGITDETAKRFNLGWTGARLSIPIYTAYNELVNIRLYKWLPEEGGKVIGYRSPQGKTYNSNRIYGVENLADPEVKTIIICEGELDRIVAEQYGFPACTATSGAYSWSYTWANLFRGKKVIVVMDNDISGEEGKERICSSLQRVTDVYCITWPEDFPLKGDITDYFVDYQGTVAGFQKLLDEAQPYVEYNADGQSLADVRDLPTISLNQSTAAKFAGKRVKIPIALYDDPSAMAQIPKRIKYVCPFADSSENKRCDQCKLRENMQQLDVELKPNSRELLKLLEVSDKVRDTVLLEHAGIPVNCKAVVGQIEEFYAISEVTIEANTEVKMEEADSTSPTTNATKLAYVVGDSATSIGKYIGVGTTYSDPKDQSAVLLFDTLHPDKIGSDEFEMTGYLADQLKVLQQAPGQSVKDKIEEIHRDLEYNVTRVWERREVAIAVDLVAHSVLKFRFQGKLLDRGWLELMLFGDSSQAKSQVAESLLEYYGVNAVYSGETAKTTGLMHTQTNNGKRWSVNWGAFPRNDGKLLVVDELSGMSPEDLGRLSHMRSKGIAQVTGAVTSATSARVRAIYISNTRCGKNLDGFTYGTQALLELWGNKAEDVRRLDLVVAVAAGDVPIEIINMPFQDREVIENKITSEIRTASMLWAWSRKPEQVILSENVERLILQRAIDIGSQYTSAIPIITATDARVKIARLAVACAAMLFSTDQSFENVVVTEEHVEYVVEFLHKLYKAKGLGYDRYSQSVLSVSDTSVDRIAELRAQYLATPYLSDKHCIKHLNEQPVLRENALRSLLGLHQDDMVGLMKFLLVNDLITPTRGNSYVRTPLGVALFKDLSDNPPKDSEVTSQKPLGFEF